MLLFLIILSSIGCLVVSFIALALVLKQLYFSQDNYIETKSQDAILLTGCDSGIGLELARYFHSTCKFKIICGFLSTDQSEGFNTLTNLSEDNRLILRKLDITSNEDVERIVKDIEKLRQDGVIKNVVALINNAGTMTYGEFDWLTWNHIQSQIDVNLVGTLRLTRALIPYIIESKGRIINISSVNDTTVFPGLSVYSATKSALSIFSRGLGFEMRKFGVHVVTVRLGDFARLTNIMDGHALKQDDMWNEMNLRKQTLYNSLFHEFNHHLLQNYGMTSPKNFEESTLFRDIGRALLSKSPPTTITCAPLSFKMFYFVIELTPVWIQYLLLELLIQFAFRFKAPSVVA